MSTITINLNDAIQRLRRAGFDEEDVIEILRALPDAQDRPVTKEYLSLFGHRLLITIGGMIAFAVGIIITVLRLPF